MMSFVASFEEIAKLSSKIHNLKTEEDVKEVYEEITNNEIFNDYEDLLKLQTMLNSALQEKRGNNDRFIIELATQLMEKYVDLRSILMNSIVLPNNVEVKVIRPNKDIQIFKEEDFSLYGLEPQTKITFYKESVEILTITIIQMDEYSNVSITPMHILEISEYSKFTLKFHNVQFLHAPSQFMNYDNELLTVLRNDDVDAFVNILSVYDISKPCRDINIIEYKDTLDDSSLGVVLAQTAILFGSVKCFKNLLLSKIDFVSRKSDMFAIRGGNPEIIRILEQQGKFKNVDNLFESSIYHHDINLSIYLFETFGTKDNGLSLSTALNEFNYEVVDFLMDKMKNDGITQDLSKCYYSQMNHFEFLVKYEMLDEIEDFSIMSRKNIDFIVRHIDSIRYSRRQLFDLLDTTLTIENGYGYFEYIIKKCFSDGLNYFETKTLFEHCLRMASYAHNITPFIKLIINEDNVDGYRLQIYDYLVVFNTIETIDFDIVDYLLYVGYDIRTEEIDGELLLNKFFYKNIESIETKRYDEFVLLIRRHYNARKSSQ